MKKIFLLFLIIALCSLSFYVFWQYRAKTGPGRAFHALLQQDYPRAEKEVAKLRTRQCPKALYLAYIAEAQKDFSAMEHYLLEASYSLSAHPRADIYLEILCAQALAAYSNQRDQEVIDFVARAEQSVDSQTLSASPPFLFLKALSSYLNSHFSQAEEELKLFEASLATTSLSKFSLYKPQGAKSWLPHFIAAEFPLSWRQTHLAHTLLEQDKEEEALTLLESTEHSSEGSLFKAFAALRRMQTLSLEAQVEALEEAFIHLRTIDSPTSFSREQAIVKRALRSLLPELFVRSFEESELQPLCVDYIELLESWNETQLLQEIANTFAPLMLQAAEEPEKFLAFSTEVILPLEGSYFHHLLVEESMLTIAQHIQQGKIFQLATLWPLFEQMAPTYPQPYAEELANLVRDVLYGTILSDDSGLKETRELLALYFHLDLPPQNHLAVAHQLLSYGRVLWQRSGEEQKGTRLIKQAKAFVTTEKDAALIHQEAEQFFNTLFQRAREANTVQRFCLIYDACLSLDIYITHQMSSVHIANYLADGYYLFDVQRYALAQTHAEWVLKLLPEHPDALRLHGLSSFYQGDYSTAFASLSQLKETDTQTSHALWLSRMYATLIP